MAGSLPTVTGWGFQGYDPFSNKTGQGDFGDLGVGSAVQQKLAIPVLTEEECEEKYGAFRVRDSQICAGGEVGKDSCKGDSGGGLLSRSDISASALRSWYLMGVVSFGSRTCGNGKPGIYTRVSHYVGWIQGNLRP